MSIRIPYRNKVPFYCCLLLLLTSGASRPADFRDVAKNPRAYHNQQVSVLGVALVQGSSSFVLYEDTQAAKEYAGPPKSLAIATRIDASPYENQKYDGRWVRVTGIVDANRHGRWNFPCEILLQRIEALSGPVVTRSTIHGIFRNEMADPVLFRLFNQAGQKYVESEIGPKAYEEFDIEDGTVEFYALTGKLIAKREIQGSSSGRYFDTVRRSFYYRLVDGIVERVLPQEGSKWSVTKDY